MTWYRSLLHAKMIKIWSAEGGKEAIAEHSSVLKQLIVSKSLKKLIARL